MAIGDQVHWGGSGATTVNLRPSSGVEVIIKECTTGYRTSGGYHNYTFAYHRSASAYYNYTTIGGTAIYTDQRQSSTYGAENRNPNMASSPINNAHYIYMTYGGSGAGYKVAGYITKD